MTRNIKIIFNFALIIICVCLMSCANKNRIEAQDTTKFNFKSEDDLEVEYPKVDGSTSLMPLMASIKSNFTGMDLDDVESKISVSRTDESYLRLIETSADLIIACEPTKETLDKVKDSIIMTPIGYDALVFLANSEFPIESLSGEQIRKIYNGDIRNWSKLGGENVGILPFQRNVNSGSYVLFDKFIMKGEKTLPPIIDGYYEGMEGLVTAMANYNNDKNAIGYSMFYYAKKMMHIDDLNIRLLKIDDIEPSDETIKNKTYPYINEFYVAIRKDENEDSVAKKLYNYILSDEGKKIIEQCGYVSLD